MRIENVVCTFCGCLCDDIVVEVEDNHITAAKKACGHGRSLFLNAHTQARQPTIDGQEVEWPQAMDEVARILSDAAQSHRPGRLAGGDH
jgi:formylmethanofuran dehydrogenase subunit B